MNSIFFGNATRFGIMDDIQQEVTDIFTRTKALLRGHFVLRKHDVAAPESRQPLAMRWYGDPGIIPFDATAGSPAREWFRFTSAPGTSAIRVQARGTVEAWIDGKPMQAGAQGRFTAVEPPRSAAVPSSIHRYPIHTD